MGSDLHYLQKHLDSDNKGKNARNNEKIIAFLEETRERFDGNLMPWSITDFRYNVSLMRIDLQSLLADLEKLGKIE